MLKTEQASLSTDNEIIDISNNIATLPELYNALNETKNVDGAVLENVDDDKKYEFTTVSEDYFSDALFIGDSRTVGFYIYKELPGAIYYANQSYGVFNDFFWGCEIPQFGIVALEPLLKIQKFGKIYINLGINNLGTDISSHKKKYEEFLNNIRRLQPQAIIFLIANLHVTKLQNANPVVNNENINLVNDFIITFADGKNIFFLDPNFLYDDINGCLDEELSYDNFHIRVKYYDRYLDFLKKCGIIR